MAPTFQYKLSSNIFGCKSIWKSILLFIPDYFSLQTHSFARNVLFTWLVCLNSLMVYTSSSQQYINFCIFFHFYFFFRNLSFDSAKWCFVWCHKDKRNKKRPLINDVSITMVKWSSVDWNILIRRTMAGGKCFFPFHHSIQVSE